MAEAIAMNTAPAVKSEWLNPRRITRPKPEDYTKAYLKSLARQGYAGRTVLNAESTIKRFLEFCRKNPKDVTGNDIDRWLNHLLEQNMKGSRVEYYARLSRYFTWLEQKGYIPARPRKSVKIRMTPEEKQMEYQYLKPADIAKIRDTYDIAWPEFKTNLRNRTIVELMIGSGARINEILSLTVENCDLLSGKIKIYGKKNAESRRKKDGTGWRTVMLQGEAQFALREYLDKSGVKRGHVFPELNKLKYPDRTLYNHIKALGETAGIPFLNLKIFRHYFATRLYEHGVDIITIAALMGDDVKTVRENYIHTDKLMDIERIEGF